MLDFGRQLSPDGQVLPVRQRFTFAIDDGQMYIGTSGHVESTTVPLGKLRLMNKKFSFDTFSKHNMYEAPAIIERRPALLFLGHISPIVLVCSPLFRCLLRFDAMIPESGTKRPGGGCATVRNGRGKSGRRRPILGG